MRLDFVRSSVVVTLSKRNLLALLQKLADPISMRSLVSENAYRDGEPIDGVLLLVRVEPDETHYAGREPPGPMHPRTEDFIARVSGGRGNAN